MSNEEPYRKNPLVAIVRRVMVLPALLVTLTLGGMLGLKHFTGGSWLDCLYMAVTTVTTVGYGEVVPMNPAARIFIMVFLFVAFGVVSYSAFQIGQTIFNAGLLQLLESHRMENKISQLRRHYIVCGLGRMGTTICRHLHERKKPFVVIDSNEHQLQSDCAEQEWLYVIGDATDDKTLRQAGIEHARALATVLPTDADNVYVVLSARLLSSQLEIIARASGDSAAEKIKRAGANRVVSPYSTGAEKIARFMLNPSVEDFLEITDGRGQDLELADVQVAPDSPYVGKRLSETDLRELGVIVVGIRRKDGERLMPPPGNAMIEAGDSLFAFGSSIAVNKMIGESSREE